jgi:hypothetical protein
MAGWKISGVLLAGCVGPLIAGHDPAFAQASLSLPGITITLPIPGIAIPSTGLPTVGLGIPTGNLGQLSVLGNSALGILLNQVAPINQQLAATTGTNLLTPVDQLLNALTSGGPTLAGILAQPGSVASFGLPNVWMWNAITVGRTDHDGFQFQANGGAGLLTGSTLPTRSLEKAVLPGVLWDASSLFGLKRGALHFGLTGGVTESDVQIRSNALLQGVGITQTGSANLTSWSVGGFALLTTGSWYTGTVVGGSWGRSEIDNFLLGSSSDYGTSGITSAWILGTIVPITNTIRFDIRGTLGYQRTVGEGHFDTLRIGYGDHTIEAVHGSLSGRLFGAFRQGGVTIRPYLQAGLAHRFHYDNELQIQGVAFTFNDADNSVFAATGIDFEINESLQLSVGVREDHSRDFDSLSGRFGLAWRLN